jgi:hypothetical protein
LGLAGSWGLLAAQAGVACVQVFGFADAMVRNPERGETGGLVWWGSLRPLHMAAYIAFAIASFLKAWWAGLILFADAAIGAAAWLFVRPRVLAGA